VVSQTVRNVGKYPQFHTVSRPEWRPRVKAAAARGFAFWQSRGLVTGVGGADRDLVAEPRQAACEALYEAGYAPVRPGVGGVGRDVKDSERPGSQ
jgi:hypothetical protein